MNRIIKQFFNDPTDLKFLRSVLTGFSVAFIPSIILSASAIFVISFFVPNILELAPEEISLTVIGFISITVITPVIETLILVGVLKFLRLFRLKHEILIVVSGLLWGVAHGLAAPLWFFGTAWSFIIYSHMYEKWRIESFSLGFWASSIPHMMKNTFAFLLMCPGL